MSVESQVPSISVVIVSFNTRDLLRECLQSLKERSENISKEVFVVDNVSRDGSADMVTSEFPEIHLIRNDVNRGFAGANNQAFSRVTGRYVVLLNSDAFLQGNALSVAIDHMERETIVGIGGARLLGRDGSWQPSARLFPSPLNHFLTISGLSARFPNSRFFGRKTGLVRTRTKPPM
ncbi:MAG TPA: glycosyltransferase [Edaphobacter sp.]|nr:glycosyltransferase [Edaphobacter sp.]